MFENKAFSETDIITCALIFIIVVLMAIATLALGKKTETKRKTKKTNPITKTNPRAMNNCCFYFPNQLPV